MISTYTIFIHQNLKQPPWPDLGSALRLRAGNIVCVINGIVEPSSLWFSCSSCGRFLLVAALGSSQGCTRLSYCFPGLRHFHVFSLLPHLAYSIPFKQQRVHYSIAQSISPKPDMSEDRGLKSYIFTQLASTTTRH